MRKTNIKLNLMLVVSFIVIGACSNSSHADVTVTLDVPNGAIIQGQNDVVFTGTITSTDSSVDFLDFGNFNLDSGPIGSDLSSAVTFNNFLAPLSLNPDQIYTGDIFSLNIDPNATTGLYGADFDISYGGIENDPNFTLNVQQSDISTPEPSTLMSLLLGTIIIMTMSLRKLKMTNVGV